MGPIRLAANDAARTEGSTLSLERRIVAPSNILCRAGHEAALKFWTLLAAFFLLGEPGFVAQTASPIQNSLASVTEACSLTPNHLDALLALPLSEFDQDMSGGWRELSNKGCELTAAMLIDTFVMDTPSSMTGTDRENLLFHAGQLYAMSGLRRIAVRRFLQALNLHERPDAELEWNAYVLASVAFLQGDREELAHQRQLLASARSTPENKTNLSVVDGLVRCFNKTYRYAYFNCRTAAK